jgi:hypothetical protein
MVKKLIAGSLLSVVVMLMVGTAAFAGTPPASCAAHCATTFGGNGQKSDTGLSVSGLARAGLMGGPNGIAQMGNCGTDPQGNLIGPCCLAWQAKFN